MLQDVATSPNTLILEPGAHRRHNGRPINKTYKPYHSRFVFMPYHHLQQILIFTEDSKPKTKTSNAYIIYASNATHGTKEIRPCNHRGKKSVLVLHSLSQCKKKTECMWHDYSGGHSLQNIRHINLKYEWQYLAWKTSASLD